MECYLYSMLEKEREGKTPFLICKWIGKQGDSDADRVVKKGKRKKLNVKAAKARIITLTKCVFPVDSEALEGWKEDLLPCVRLVEDEDGEIVEKKVKDEDGKVVTEQSATVADLCYTSIPISKLTNDFDAVVYTNVNGVEQTLTSITVIGWADENGNWDEELDAETTARNNLNNGLADGTYIPVEKDED